ncbi:hypothetical protein NQZ68_015725 [Dissostichus eleginoides]|nr:hypothetical protein NQZ68_015725 [Dissostichus eleginoides]
MTLVGIKGSPCPLQEYPSHDKSHSTGSSVTIFTAGAITRSRFAVFPGLGLARLDTSVPVRRVKSSSISILGLLLLV